MKTKKFKVKEKHKEQFIKALILAIGGKLPEQQKKAS